MLKSKVQGVNWWNSIMLILRGVNWFCCCVISPPVAYKAQKVRSLRLENSKGVVNLIFLLEVGSCKMKVERQLLGWFKRNDIKISKAWDGTKSRKKRERISCWTFPKISPIYTLEFSIYHFWSFLVMCIVELLLLVWICSQQLHELRFDLCILYTHSDH